MESSLQSVVETISCPNEGVERYFSHKKVPYERYSREWAIKELMGGRTDVLDIAKMEVSNRVLVHAISQNVIPQINKSNAPTFLEIFYCWCANARPSSESPIYHHETHSICDYEQNDRASL